MMIEGIQGVRRRKPRGGWIALDWLSSVRSIRSLRCGALPAALEAASAAVHLQDVDMVGEPVQQRSGQPLRSEDLGPFVEGEVGGDQDGAPFVALAEDFEELKVWALADWAAIRTISVKPAWWVCRHSGWSRCRRPVCCPQ